MNDNDRPEHSEIEALLPWYAAGTLARREADAVEKVLAADAELARRLALVRAELDATVHLNESVGRPSARVGEKLFAAIAAEPVRLPFARRLALSETWRSLSRSETWRTFSWRGFARSAGAAFAVFLLQAGMPAWMVHERLLQCRPGAGGRHRGPMA
jgi:anti-sigma factor RsiW